MKRSITIALSLLVLVSVACAPTTTRRTFKENWHDSKMSSKIKWNMGKDKEVQAGNIHVDTWRGVVTMTGRAITEQEKAKAEEIAKNTENVKEVRNYIDVVGEGKIETAKKETGAFKKPYSYTYKEAATDEPLKEDTIAETADNAVEPVVETPEPAPVVKKESKKAVAVKKPAKKYPPVQKEAKVISDPLMADEPVVVTKPGKRQNAVSYEIGKELTRTQSSLPEDKGSAQSLSSIDDITEQAEMELQELRSKKRSK